MKRNEDELNRPVYRQALAHSCLLLRFLSTGGETNGSKKKKSSVASGIRNYFPLLPTRVPCMGDKGPAMFGFFPRSAASSGERERESETAADSVATGKHVQATASSTSSAGGSGGSRQRRIIQRIPGFIKESLFYFNLPSHSNCMISLWLSRRLSCFDFFFCSVQ